MSSPGRTPDQITADMDATRYRLAGSIDQLVHRAQPKTLLHQQKAALQARLRDENGKVRTDLVAKAGAGVLGAVIGVLVLRRILR